MNINKKEKDVIISDITDFDLRQTLESGQCFRFYEHDDGFTVYAGDRRFELSQHKDTLTIFNANSEDTDFIINYFDLERDYGVIKAEFCRCDSVMSCACAEGYGIRILKQDLFETLITFILTQNNNIPRIKGIVERLCEQFGDKMQDLHGDYYAFPTLERLSNVTVDELAPLRAGFRAKYIVDAVQKISSGVVSLAGLPELSYDDAKAELMKIVGVGEKVANCVLLFGANMLSAFPVDVWIRRTIDRLYSGSLDTSKFGKNAGIANQYLFYYVRKSKLI